MRLALFSDVHGNITGARAVLEAVEALGGADVLVCAGDMVGWPGTGDLMDLLTDRGVRMVRGNGEDLFLDFEAETQGKAEQFLAPMRVRNAWLQAHQPRAAHGFYAALPRTLSIEAAPGQRVLVCHSTPASAMGRESRIGASLEELCAAYGGVDAEVVVHGHAHHHGVRWVPRGVRVPDARAEHSADTLKLVGVGSVGARADGLSAFTMLVLASGHWTVRQFQVPYDIEEEARLCRERDVPDMAAFPAYRPATTFPV